MLFGFLNLGPTEIIIILAVGVLLFGRRLPEVGRYLGKGIVEFKKGLKGLEDDVEGQIARADAPPPPSEAAPPRPPQRVSASAPKFDENTDAPPPA